MKKKILNNLGLKLLSIMIAIVVWFVVVMTNNPKDTKSFYNIPVVLTNVELLENENKVYQVLDNTNIVRVTVEMPRDLMSKLSSSDIVAEADVSKLTEINTVPISCYVINEELNGNISDISCNRDVVRLSVEDKTERWFNVEYRQVGDVAEGYIVDNVERNPTRIKISGPKSAVDNISRVVAEVDVSNATSNVTVNIDTALYDADNNELHYNNITKSEDNVNVEVKVLATKEVPLEVSYMGTPAEGYLVTSGIRYEPSMVTLSGTLGTLMNVTKIVIPETEIDITGATETFEGSVDIRRHLPSNTKLLDSATGGKVAVTIEIEPEAERVITVPERNIIIQSLPEGLVAEFEEAAEPYRLTLTGLRTAVSAVEQNTLTGTVDIAGWMEDNNMEELSPGSYELPVSFELPENIIIKEEMTVRLNIVEEEE